MFDRDTDGKNALTSNAPDLREFIDRGLLAVSQNAFHEALESFQKAADLDPANIMVSSYFSFFLFIFNKCGIGKSFYQRVLLLISFFPFPGFEQYGSVSSLSWSTPRGLVNHGKCPYK